MGCFISINAYIFLLGAVEMGDGLLEDKFSEIAGGLLSIVFGSIVTVKIIQVLCSAGDFGEFFCMYVEPLRIFLDSSIDLIALIIRAIPLMVPIAFSGFLLAEYIKRKSNE